MVRETSNEALCSPFIADVLVQDLNMNISASRRREILVGGKYPAVGPMSGRCRTDVGPMRAGRRRKVPFSASILTFQ